MRWISDTVMVAPDLSECSLASSSAASTTSSIEYEGRRRTSMQKLSVPGMVLTLSTVEGLLVGSNVENGGENIGSCEENLSARRSIRSARK